MASSATQPVLHSVAKASIPRSVWVVLGLWLAFAVAFAGWVGLQRLPPLAVPISIWGQALLVLFAIRKWPSVRAAVAAVPTHALVAYHILRAPIGALFLFQLSMGLLTPEFAVPAGYGDIAVGLTAIFASIAAWRSPERSRRAVALWNLFGLIDILMVFVTAQRILLFGDGWTALPAFSLPLNQLIPLILVPLVLVTHVLVYQRTRSNQVQ